MTTAAALRPADVLAFRTPRLLLACWRADDAPLLKEAIEASLDHLRPWMPWAAAEPSPVEVIAERLAGFRTRYVEGADFPFAIFTPDRSRVLGGAGLHRRRGPRALEIGYWVRHDAVGRGLASEAAAVLTRAAFELHDVEWVEIRCDPANVPSAAVPRRLGYRLATRLVGNATKPTGEPRDTLVWQLNRTRFASSSARRLAFDALAEDGAVVASFGAD